MAAFDNGNDMWGTIQAGISAARDIVVNRNTSTTATPSGSVAASAPFNPFPNMFSAYPQADGKAGAPQVLGGFALNPLWVIIGGAILAILFLARR